METTYYVLNEHTLGFVFSVTPNSFEVLTGKPQLGGHDWKDGSVAIGRTDFLRAATLADFQYYRVNPTGHIAYPERKMFTAEQLTEIQQAVWAETRYASRMASEGRSFMSWISTRLEIVAITS